MTDNKETAAAEALEWLVLRLKRASFVERELLKLIKKTPLDDKEKKRYEELCADNKGLAVKDVLCVLEAVSGGEDGQYGFEEFE